MYKKKKKHINFGFTITPNDMLQLHLSEAETQMLNYERYYYPCPLVQKRIQAIYLKATLCISNEKVGKIVGLHRESVSKWVHFYKKGGFEGVCQFAYGLTKVSWRVLLKVY